MGWPPLPLPRSGQENVKKSRQVVIFGVILPFYKGKNGSKFSQNRNGQAGGGWPPSPVWEFSPHNPFFSDNVPKRAFYFLLPSLISFYIIFYSYYFLFCIYFFQIIWYLYFIISIFLFTFILYLYCLIFSYFLLHYFQFVLFLISYFFFSDHLIFAFVLFLIRVYCSIGGFVAFYIVFNKWRQRCTRYSLHTKCDDHRKIWFCFIYKHPENCTYYVYYDQMLFLQFVNLLNFSFFQAMFWKYIFTRYSSHTKCDGHKSEHNDYFGHFSLAIQSSMNRLPCFVFCTLYK